MHFSMLFSAVAFGGGNTGFLIAIAALACILGAEIAGICILISKMARARRARYERHQEEDSSTYQSFAVGAFLMLGAIPQATYTTLTVLAVLTAAAAVVFLVLLIVFCARGYSFVSADLYHAEQKRKNAVVEEQPLFAEVSKDEDTLAAFDEAPSYDVGEEQRQYAYTEDDGTEVEGEQIDEPLSAFDEAPVSDGEELIDEVDETQENIEAVTAVEPVVIRETTVSEAAGEPAFADGTRPYKVVEKVVTETYKEVYKETPPAQAAQPAANPAADAVMEKLADFLDYELQKRKESDRAEEEAKKDGSIETFGASSVTYMDDDSDEEDEDDETEGDTEGDETEDADRDDEENDTDGDHFTGNERIIGFDEETGCYIVAHYRKSFEAKLIQARPNIKKYYSELKNALLSYKGTKNRISWTADSFHNGRSPIAKINVKTRILELYLALDPASLEGTVYRGKDVGSKKKYADTPFQYKLRTPRKFKWAMELVQRVCEEHGLSPIDIEHIDYDQQYPFDTTENLVERKLIKEYIRQEKPATSFELDPDHVPAVPEEDDSVIPANANFTWEFDNDRMVEQEPVEEVVEETVEEEPTVEEPVAEEAPAEPAPSIVKETVKVTEMRYTERYYADARPTYEQVITTSEPIEAEAVPAEAVVETVYETESSAFEKNTEDATEETVEEMVEETEAESEEIEDAVDVWGDLTGVAIEQETDETYDEEDEPEELFFEDENEEQVEDTESYESIEANVQEETDEPTEETAWEESYTETVEETAEETAEVPDAEPIRKRIINPSVAVVDLCTVEEHFPPDSVVKLDTLKAKGLILPTASTLKVYAGGELSKPLTVEAHHFTLEAIKAISDADGDAIMIR